MFCDHCRRGVDIATLSNTFCQVRIFFASFKMFFLFVVLLLPPVFGTFYELNPKVVELTGSNFDELVTKSKKVWLVEFFAPWCKHCKALAPEYAKVAYALDGIVNVGAVNADEHELLASRFSVDSYPTIKIFGSDKKNPSNYDGERTASNIVDSAMKVTNGIVKRNIQKRSHDEAVVTLTDSNFDSLVTHSKHVWMVDFYAPWCPHCQHLAPEWASAASELEGTVKFGSLDATSNRNSAEKYGVNAYPTIKLFTPQGHIVDYDGDRTSSDIVGWASSKAGEHSQQPAEVKQIVSKDMFKRSCEDKQLCVVSILPSIKNCEASCRKDYLTMLKQVGTKFKRNMWGWTWTESGSQKELENALGMESYGSPSMVVLNPRKMKYSVLKGPFSKESIEEFLDNILKGRGNGSPVNERSIPFRVTTLTPWAGHGEEPEATGENPILKNAVDGEMKDAKNGKKDKQRINITLDAEGFEKDEL